MNNWRPKQSDLKRYPHFDQVLSLKRIEAIVTDPIQVAQNSFFPLIRYSKGWQPFRKEGDKRPKPKQRPIRYAARRDAYIFSYYRSLLSEKYEAELERLGISHCPIAYRRLLTIEKCPRGKCNIHFANDAFQHIRDLGDCSVITLDISSYFESLDHGKLKALWCRILGVSRLPDDHFKVFEAITKYACVDKHLAYERLGYYGQKKITKNGKPIMGYLIPFESVPTQLCSPYDFRQKILGENGMYPSLIEKNEDMWGIPQGAPISDLLANLYLIDFDAEMNGKAVDSGGKYFRYSDDIILILPKGSKEAISVMQDITERISSYGEKLIIKPEKSTIHYYERRGDRQIFSRILGTQGAQGIEYLGFRFDGKNVYLRDSTLSSLHRKIAFAARSYAEATVRRYPDKDYNSLRTIFDFESFSKKFGRVEEFEPSLSYKKWTFWTYVMRSVEVFGPYGKTIHGQMKRLRSRTRHRVDLELQKALQRKAKREATSGVSGS